MGGSTGGSGSGRSGSAAAMAQLPMLTSRLHVDLQRTSSAVCSRG